VLQVVVKDAVNAETDNTVARIQQDLQTYKLQGQPMKPDPNNPQIIKITGIDRGQGQRCPQRSGRPLRHRVRHYRRLGQLGHADHEALAADRAEDKTVDQAIDTINDRVNKLGVSEPVIAPYGLGDNQILVELPGVSDLNRSRHHPVHLAA
jgi:preprotein translocase subunit SecD